LCSIHSSCDESPTIMDVANVVFSSNPKDKEFYNKVRKSDPTTYYSNEFQLKMQKAAQANPKLYFGE